MAVTRKLLKALGIEDDKVEQIIEAHAETVEALKSERDTYKADAQQLAEARREIESLKGREDYREMYEAEHKAFEDYKSGVAAQAAQREKADLYRAALIEAGVDSRRIDSVMRVTDLSGVTVEDGAIVDRDKTIEGIRSEWKDFIIQTRTKPSTVDTPPQNSTGGTKEPENLAEALRWRLQTKG